MNIVDVYRRFPKEDDCIAFLEETRWHGKPKCPYCDGANCTPIPREHRHHCNTCNTTFSVTVKTIFHRTHVPLQKWFLAISLVLDAKRGISARQLGRDVQVSKDTAWSMAMRIRRSMVEQRHLLSGIVEMDETYVGGKPRKGTGEKNKRGRRTKKTAVIGMVERGGHVRAAPPSNLKLRTITALVRGNIDTENATLITTLYHRVWYAEGGLHTNNIESFWAILKRGMVGQFHKVSVRHMPKRIDECCYRYIS